MSGFVMYGMLYIFIHSMMKLGWWRWRVEGLENLPPRHAGGMIVAMNHVHWMDIPTIGALLPFSYRLSWLGKTEIFEHPIAGWWFRAMKVIPIKRGARDLAAMAASEEALRNGAVLLIFPEGHRSRDGQLQKGHGGTVRLAMRSGVPIVPLAITGTEQGFGGTLRGNQVCMRIGKPYMVEPTRNNKIPVDVMEHMTTDLMLRIATLLPEEQRGYYRDQIGWSQTLPSGPRSALQP
jgi:1-acyl-sn-glycerol-3-phosphate acyltransferase